MGAKLSIDKHVSNLEDILELNTKLLDKIKFESNIPDCITQHLKIWKFQEDKHPIKKVSSEPINLSAIQTSGFNFLSNECYLVLLIYKKAHEKYNQFTNFPHQMWGVVESYSNLTPRGLGCPIASSEKFESFLLPQRILQSTYEYMIFAWNGKQANPLVKAQTLSNAFEIENLLNKGKDPLLEILFSGGVIRNKKLSKGSIVQLSSQAESSPVEINEQQNENIRETVYLFNFLFPVPEKERKREFSKLNDFLQKKEKTEYSKNFVQFIPEEKSEVTTEAPTERVQQPVKSNKVPVLNFSHIQPQVPKMDLNCKNIPQDSLSSQREVEIGLPLVEGVEYKDIEKKPNTMKLSLLNLKPTRDQTTTFKDIEQEDSQGFNFDIRDTERKKLKIEYYAEICSQVVDNYLYVGGEQIAYNREVLKQIGVTHVINCAGDVCKNKYPQDFQYTTFYLKDSKTENIECLFYQVINIIENERDKGGKVLIHCVQGVSRSVSLCIAYLIYSKRTSYSQAFDIIKKNRGVASPNMGFTVQLLLFQKRLQASYDSIPVSPRVFAVGRGVSGTTSLVCRMLMDQLFTGKIIKTFDTRGVFIVQSEKHLFLWVGPDCSKQEQYIKTAIDYTEYLKLNEKAHDNMILEQAHNERKEFWQLWGFQEKPPMICQKNKEWDQWYEDVDEEQFMREKEFTQQMYSSDKSDEQAPTNVNKLFIYPSVDDPIAVFDLEDLDHTQLQLLMKDGNGQLQVFIWRGNNWIGNDDEERNYVDFLINRHYSHVQHENIFVYKEEPNEESDEFLDCFQ